MDKVAEWRYGPARLWYDMLNVPDNGEDFDYGLKLRVDEESDDGEDAKATDDPDDAFTMVTQMQWEDSVVWNADDIKENVLKKLKDKNQAAGWIPTGLNRTASSFSKQLGIHWIQPQGLSNAIANANRNARRQVDIGNSADNSSYSIFPVENEDLVYGLWEDEIIWDPEAMHKILKPKVLTLDPSDENLILEMPNDVDPNANTDGNKDGHKNGTSEKESKTFFNSKDPFNISNDEYYNPKITQDAALRLNIGANLIQHSIPAQELRTQYFPTYIGPAKLRKFHRPTLKFHSYGRYDDKPRTVMPLTNYIKQCSKLRDKERTDAGGGDIFMMRDEDDLSGSDGDIILVEFAEEYPPLLNQVGMCSKIRNFYKRKPGKDDGPPSYKFGETAYGSPFLGNLYPGQSLQYFENNMFRAPLYEHTPHETDFLIIKKGYKFFIRFMDALYSAGQTQPLIEVNSPHSKNFNNFINDYLQVTIYRLLQQNDGCIKMDDVKKFFPNISENFIRKRLKSCADFQRHCPGSETNSWYLKQDFRLPAEEELRAMVSPEQCCTYYSTMAAELRLKDAGYGQKTLVALDNDEESQMKLDDEVKAAPWNTTRAFIEAMKGNCLLQLSGPADPTGCGEGMSYVRIPKQTQRKDDDIQIKKSVTGTDADLRKLPMPMARLMLKNAGVPESAVKKLTRWELIDAVRTLSNEQAKAGRENKMTSKYARVNKFSFAEHQRRYKEECQRLFDLQNKVLSSTDVLSTDEEESEEDEEYCSDVEEMSKNLEKMLSENKTEDEVTFEKEEEERKELIKFMMGDDSNSSDSLLAKKKKEEEESTMNRVLKIYRTFKNENGEQFVRTETVKRSAVIDIYVKIRQTKSEEFIKRFSAEAVEQQKLRQEKRRLQEQLRRLEKIEEEHLKSSKDNPIETNGRTATNASHQREIGKKVGEVKRLSFNDGITQRTGPSYRQSDNSNSISVAMTEEQEQQEERKLKDHNLVKVEDTKLIISKSLIKHTEEVKRKALVLKLPRDRIRGGNGKRRGADDDMDYLVKPGYRTSKRARTDPLVTLSIFLDDTAAEMRALPGTELFWFPVDAKKVPDYYDLVKKPMSFQTIRRKIRENNYTNREQFLQDSRQICENSRLYNGDNHFLTKTAEKILELVVNKFTQNEETLVRLEQLIHIQSNTEC